MEKKIRKKRLFILIDTIETERAGTEKQILLLLKGLSKDKFDCHLGCIKSSNWMNSTNLQWPLFVVGSNSLRDPKFYFGIAKMIRYLRKKNIDIFQAHFPLSITAGVLAARISGIKNIISCRRDMGFWYNKKILSALRLFNRCVNLFIANSREIRKMICEIEGIRSPKVKVIHNGIEIPDLPNSHQVKKIKNDLRIPEEVSIIGIVSNMNRKVKRLDLFIDAAFHVLKKYQKVIFIVIGYGQYLPELKEKAKKLGIMPNMRFLGSHPNPMQIIPVFDIGVNSSDSEGFSNAVIEYMACGKPVIATNIGGNIEIIEEGVNGLLVPAGDAKEMSKKMISLLTDNTLKKKMGKSAYEKAIHFSYEKMINNFEQVYQKM